MKTGIYITVLCAFLLTGTNAFAKIWRVNNNGAGTLPLIAADFTTLQAAHDGAAVGDTLHIEQSPTSYGNCTFTKRLVVIGVGYYLTANPKTQVNKDFTSVVGALTLVNGASAGTVITGLTQSAGVAWIIGANNISILRNRFTYAAGPRIYLGTGNATPCDGITIQQNSIEGSTSTYAVQTTPGTSGLISNMNVTGNIIAGAYGFSLGANASGIFKNNQVSVSYNPINLVNFYVVNNMSYSSTSTGNTFDNCNIEFNMGTVAGHFISPAGSGNIIGTGNVTVAIGGWNLLGGPSPDGQYQLQASSPAKGAGKSGDDMGAYGGSIPYKLSGMPSVPNIYSMTVDPIPAGATSIGVTIATKSNN